MEAAPSIRICTLDPARGDEFLRSSVKGAAGREARVRRELRKVELYFAVVGSVEFAFDIDIEHFGPEAEAAPVFTMEQCFSADHDEGFI